MNRYLTQWFLATALILLAVAAINLVVDPYGIFRLVDSPGFNSVKPAAPSRGPMAKAYQVLRVQPKTLILGNSRAELGLDPNHPAWPQAARPVYNAALPGTGTGTSLRYLQHVLAANAGNPAAQPTLVLWGVDFMDFLTDPTQPTPPRNAHVGDAESRRLMQASATDRLRQQVRDYAGSTLTLAAFMDSVQTLASQRNPYAVDLTPQGFNPMHDYLKITADEGYWAVFRQKDLMYDKTFARFPKGIFDASGNTSKHWQDLQDIMRLCRQHGIELRLFTYPYQAHMLDTFAKTGHAPGLALWKRALAKTLADEAAASVQPAFALWDFSTLSAITAEAVPQQGDRKSSMRWYWEAGHFKSELGGVMLVQMLGQAASLAK
jgi:hypothetical protein